MDEIMLRVAKKLTEDRLDAALSGTMAWLACGTAAAGAASRGEPWKLQKVAQQYAEYKGRTMWTVLQCMRYALRKAGVEGCAQAYLESIVEGCQLEN